MTAKTFGYWTTTGLLALTTLGSGVAKLTHADEVAQGVVGMGYPMFMLDILGFWYVAAAIAFVAPGLGRLKEWAYAGFAFAMSGAVASHLFSGDALAEVVPVLVLGGLAAASYLLRPPSRRLVA